MLTNALNATTNSLLFANETGSYWAGHWTQSSSYILSPEQFAYNFTDGNFNYWDGIYDNLQDYQYVKLDLVKGKDFWRLTSASKTNLLENLSNKKDAYLVFVNIAKLLKKLLAGEESNPELFQNLLNGLFLLEKYDTEEELRNIEIITVLRILDNLGYIGGDGALNTLTKSPFEENLLFETAKKRNQILSLINQALKETHL